MDDLCTNLTRNSLTEKVSLYLVVCLCYDSPFYQATVYVTFILYEPLQIVQCLKSPPK